MTLYIQHFRLFDNIRNFPRNQTLVQSPSQVGEAIRLRSSMCQGPLENTSMMQPGNASSDKQQFNDDDRATGVMIAVPELSTTPSFHLLRAIFGAVGRQANTAPRHCGT
jgi:hypothetical protein